MKQETLEEAYNRIYKSIDFTEFDFASFAIGAKWQQEQNKKLYSEEDIQKLRQLFKNRFDCYANSDNVVMAVTENTFINIILEFEQFKKKQEN
jgi:shikimate kinase